MKKLLFFVILVSAGVGIYFSTHKDRSFNPKETITDSSFFIPISIDEYSSTQCPCLTVQVGDENIPMKLDLGFRGNLSISSFFIDRIADKTFIGTTSMHGFRGKEYQENLYSIPKIKIGSLIFYEPTIHEIDEGSRKDFVIVRNGKEPSPQKPGKLGWELFYESNLLLDLENSLVAFCDSVETLKNTGYKVDTFAEAPLLLDRGLVEFDVTTDKGPLRCVLDTGCTFNLLNVETEKDPTELLWNPENHIHYSSLKVDHLDLGSIVFRPLPIKLPIHIEAALGAEFLFTHLVFIDFKNQKIYFAQNRGVFS